MIKKTLCTATLMMDNNMWSYSPKVNRVIKVPSSMMGQSWMGSDFSNKDVSRADDIVDQYDHTLLATEEIDGHTVWTIQSVPHEEAAVVWGKEVLRVRDDYVLLEQEFWDQDGVLVKTLESLEIGEMGGRTIALRQRMAKTETDDGAIPSLVSSFSQSWVWGGKNISGVAEYFYNGFGTAGLVLVIRLVTVSEMVLDSRIAKAYLRSSRT